MKTVISFINRYGAQFLLLIRFGIVGIIATLTYLIASNLFIEFTTLRPAIGSVCGYLTAMIVSFTGQGLFTFKKQKLGIRELWKFIFMSFCGILISYWSVVFVTDIFSWPANIGTLVATVFIPLMTFIVMKFWIFKQ